MNKYHVMLYIEMILVTLLVVLGNSLIDFVTFLHYGKDEGLLFRFFFTLLVGGIFFVTLKRSLKNFLKGCLCGIISYILTYFFILYYWVVYNWRKINFTTKHCSGSINQYSFSYHTYFFYK